MNQPITVADPFTLKNGRTLKNRLFKSAMSEQLGERDRNPGEALVNLYRTWAEGGCAVLVSGNIMVDREHLGEPGNVVLDEHSDLAAFRRWTAAGSHDDTEFWAQLNHPGRQTPKFLTRVPVAPSAVGLGKGLEKAFNAPRALAPEEVLTIIGRFATSARLAKEAGFTGVQIHGAHGYLVSQFLSPDVNRRTDEWGGPLENRMRFVLEVYRAIRAAVGDDYPVAIKLNSADFQKGGFSEQESMQVVEALAGAGIDLIEISGGTYENPEMAQETPKQSTREREAFFLDYAEQVRARVDVPLAVTGGFRSTQGMNRALQGGALDLVGIARPMAFEPALPRRVLEDDAYTVELPHLTTGIKTLDFFAAHNVYWYQNQLWRMGRKKAPKPDLSPWRSFAATMLNNGRHALRRVRA